VSWSDEYFMERGYRVRHKYARGRGNTRTCELCGCKRKRFSSGWRYRPKGVAEWHPANPPCARRTKETRDE